MNKIGRENNLNAFLDKNGINKKNTSILSYYLKYY